MRKRRNYSPTLSDILEERVVLSATPSGLAARGVTGLHDSAAPRGTIAKLDQRFDEFTTDYFANRKIYLDGAASSATFNQYTTQRVNLLSQQLVTILYHVPQSTSRPKGKAPGLQTFIVNRIASPNVPSSLVASLNNVNSVPPQGTKPPGLNLYDSLALSAIDTARTAAKAAAHIFPSNTFNSSHSHK
ncbi:MAG: hypothetical protein NVSMB9_36660 [Isosphaeraceae bacterium]